MDRPVAISPIEYHLYHGENMNVGNDDYIDAIHTHIGYRPTIPPGDDARLGDVGIIDDGRFSRMANLEDFGIDFEQRKDDSKVSYYYESERGVESRTKAKGDPGGPFEVLGEAEAGVRVTFSGENKVVFKATDCRETKIDNVNRVKREVMALAADDGSDWDDDYSVVTEKLTADSFVVLVSGSAGGTVELRAKGDIEAIGSLETELGFDKELAYSENMSLKTVAESGGDPAVQGVASEEKSGGADSQPVPGDLSLGGSRIHAGPHGGAGSVWIPGGRRGVRGGRPGGRGGRPGTAALRRGTQATGRHRFRGTHA